MARRIEVTFKADTRALRSAFWWARFRLRHRTLYRIAHFLRIAPRRGA